MAGARDEGDGADEPLHIFFADGLARGTIWSSGTVAGALIILGFVSGDPLLMLSSLMPMAVSAYHLPMAQNDRAQLVLTDQGVFIDGLGVIPWTEIQNAALWDPQAPQDADGYRPGADAALDPAVELILETRHAIEFTVDPQMDLSLMRTFQVMVWRLEELNVLRIRLEPLNVDPLFLADAVRRSLRRSRNWFF